MTSRSIRRAGLCVSVCLACVGQAGQKVAIRHHPDDPMHAFGVRELKQALTKAGHTVVDAGQDVHIVFSEFKPGMGPQSFRIQKEGQRGIRIVSGDSVGAMYGALELAEQITLGGGLDAVREKSRKPYVLRRGLKFNIPLDARASSYDDTGTSAHQNIPVMWEWDFWKEFIDNMIYNRYNVLTLWTNHPYPGIVKLPKYPEANYDDVRQLREPADENADRHWDRLDVFDPTHTQVVRKISLDDKIAFWQRIFNYAEDHGIEIYIFHWNIYTFGAEGKYGITDSPYNEKTIAYMRYCITEFLKTYPQIDGIGVAAGEHFGDFDGLGQREKWLWQTYGLGIMDYHREHPDREIRCIFRNIMADPDSIVTTFKDYTAGPFNTEHKYVRARVHSTTTSPYLDVEYRKDLEPFKVPCWLNLRNDDLFVLRWGDPDYVREFMANLPRDMMRWEAGYYLGPDGFVQGREFVAKDPNLSGQLEVDKHWYRFMMFGRLGYDPTLTRDYFESRLRHRFPAANAALLYDTLAASSKIVPQVNRFFFRVNDFQFSPEGCISDDGFLTVDDSFFKYGPLQGSGILSVQEYARTLLSGQPFDGITPMDVADNLDAFAQQALAGVKSLRQRTVPDQKELRSVLGDLEAMAYLGRYYGDKIRGAAELAVFRADPKRMEDPQRVVAHFANAVDEWQAYAAAATAQYKPQLFSRTHYMDWWRILEEVRRELETVKKEIGAR